MAPRKRKQVENNQNVKHMFLAMSNKKCKAELPVADNTAVIVIDSDPDERGESKNVEELTKIHIDDQTLNKDTADNCDYIKLSPKSQSVGNDDTKGKFENNNIVDNLKKSKDSHDNNDSHDVNTLYDRLLKQGAFNFEKPYYSLNFETMMDVALNPIHDNLYLFTDDELRFFEDFQHINGCARNLYIRLFQRKHRWLSPSKISYPEISNDPTAISCLLDILVNQGLLCNITHLTSLQDALRILPSQDLKLLAASIKIETKSKTKEIVIKEILKQSKRESVFTIAGKSPVIGKLLKKLFSCSLLLMSISFPLSYHATIH